MSSSPNKGGPKVTEQRPRSSKTAAPPSQHATLEAPAQDLTIPIFIALFIILLTLGYFFWNRKSRRGRSVLLVGPCEAGKTSIFARLVGGGVVQTVTSLVPNELEYSPRTKNGKASLTIKDLPGHDRVQVKFWDSNKLGARAIICVVDASAGNKGIREAADVLYRVLTDSTVSAACPNIYILANKQDLPTAKGIKLIRTHLEKELTTLRMTKAAGLTSTKGKETSGKLLGKMDKDFDFDHLSNIKIEFGEGCGNGDLKELEGLFLWLDNTVA